ncbi:unnamed protein product [Closterium sp. NIES-54]
MDSFTAGPVSSREGRSQRVSQAPAYLLNSYVLPSTVRRQVTTKPRRSLPKNANAQQARAPPSAPLSSHFHAAAVTPSHGGGDSRMSHGSTSDSSSSTARSSRQDEEDAVEGESSRRRRKRNVNEVLQGSARQECEPEAPPAASSDDNPNEALPRLNSVQSDDEDAAEAEDEEEAGTDEEDVGVESWPHETPVTREEMTSLRELQEATARAISRLESVFLAKPAGDGEQKRKRRRKRASRNGKRRTECRTRTTSDTASEDEEEAEEGLEGHIRSSTSAILQEALSLLPADKGWKQICEQARDHLFIRRPNKHLTFYPSSAAKTWGICAVVDNLPVNYASLALAADKARRVDFNRSLSDWKTGVAGRVRDISLPKLGLFRDERDAKSPWAPPSMRTLARVRDRVGLADVDAGTISGGLHYLAGVMIVTGFHLHLAHLPHAQERRSGQGW